MEALCGMKLHLTSENKYSMHDFYLFIQAFLPRPTNTLEGGFNVRSYHIQYNP